MMGGRIAPEKTLVMSTSGAARQLIKRLRPVELDGHVKVACDARDLGTHISLGSRMVGVTGTKRLKHATACARALEALRAPFETKLACVGSKILPGGLYGAQAAPVAKKELNELGTAILRALYPGAARG
eukprot:495180-Alexandrium_andersonii.AAC.1